MARKEDLTDEQWAIIGPLITEVIERTNGKNRPRVHHDRSVMNGILWVLRTGACWAELPDCFPSSSTYFRRFSTWVKAGILRKILEALAQDMEQRGNIDLKKCFIDGTFMVAKKGASVLEKLSGAEGEAHGNYKC